MYFLFVGTLFVTFLMSINATNQLSFSGGGAFGAVELGILKKIRESYPFNYDRYTGISAGGLNSGFLSHFADVDEGIKEAEEMYSTIRNKPYGEITYYYVDSKALTGFNMLNFDKGTELIDIGYNNVKYNKYKLC